MKFEGNKEYMEVSPYTWYRAEVFIWKNFPTRLPRSRLEKPRSREASQLALSHEHIENFTKDSEVGRDLGNRASVVLVFYKRCDWFVSLFLQI